MCFILLYQSKTGEKLTFHHLSLFYSYFLFLPFFSSFPPFFSLFSLLFSSPFSPCFLPFPCSLNTILFSLLPFYFSPSSSLLSLSSSFHFSSIFLSLVCHVYLSSSFYYHVFVQFLFIFFNFYSTQCVICCRQSYS